MPSREEMQRWYTQTYYLFTYIFYFFLNLFNKKNSARPHQAYVELNELRGEVWQETGRWVGYEENLSPATGQWSQAHISYLTFKSLIQLRKVMSTGETPCFLLPLDILQKMKMAKGDQEMHNLWCPHKQLNILLTN